MPNNIYELVIGRLTKLPLPKLCVCRGGHAMPECERAYVNSYLVFQSIKHIRPRFSGIPMAFIQYRRHGLFATASSRISKREVATIEDRGALFTLTTIYCPIKPGYVT